MTSIEAYTDDTTDDRRKLRSAEDADAVSNEGVQRSDLWSAPVAHQALQSLAVIPGSKSLSNRYLILAALGHDTAVIKGLLRSRDTDLMADALRALGVDVSFDEQDETTVTVTPPANGIFKGNSTVFCGLAGTVMRFVPGLAFFADGPVHFDGDEQAYARPMHPVLDGLEQLGAHVEYEGESGFLPFTVVPPVRTEPSDAPAKVIIDSSSSSQFISSLLLIGSKLPHGMDLKHNGDKLPSMPHILMTMADVNDAGGQVQMPESGHWTVPHRDLMLPNGVVVEPDLSNAAPFLGAAMIVHGSVSVPHWPTSTTQPGGLLPGILQKMGATVTLNGRPFNEVMQVVQAQKITGSEDAHVLRNATLTVSMNGPIHGLGKGFDLSVAGEITPSVAALATLADGPSELVGIGHLRGHETNRLAALVTEINRIGASARELPDGIAITPADRRQLHGEIMETYADHRMATFAAMIGLVVPGTLIRDIETTNKTIPDFPGMWLRMLGAESFAEEM